MPRDKRGGAATSGTSSNLYPSIGVRRSRDSCSTPRTAFRIYLHFSTAVGRFETISGRDLVSLGRSLGASAIYSPGVFSRGQEFAPTIRPGNTGVSLPAPIIEWTIGSGAVANDPLDYSRSSWRREGRRTIDGNFDDDTELSGARRGTKERRNEEERKRGRERAKNSARTPKRHSPGPFSVRCGPESLPPPYNVSSYVSRLRLTFS